MPGQPAKNPACPLQQPSCHGDNRNQCRPASLFPPVAKPYASALPTAFLFFPLPLGFALPLGLYFALLLFALPLDFYFPLPLSFALLLFTLPRGFYFPLSASFLFALPLDLLFM